MSQGLQTEWWRPAADIEPLEERSPSVASSATQGATPFWWLVAFTFVMILSPQNHFPVLAPLRIALLLAIGTALTFWLDRARHGLRLSRQDREHRIVAALVVWAIVTVPASLWPGGSVSFLLESYLKTVAMFWLLSYIVDTSRRIRSLAWVLTWLTIPLSLTAVFNYSRGIFGEEFLAQRILVYDAALTSNPNDLALLLSLFLPLNVALISVSRTPLARALLYGIGALSVCAVVVSFSRAGFITMGAVLLIYSWRWTARGHPGLMAATILAALLCYPILPSDYLSRLATIGNIAADATGSAQTRWADTLTALEFVIRRPIVGAGINSDILALNDERGATWTHVHNVYLQYGVDLGLPGLLLFVFLFVGCLKAAAFARRRTAEDPGATDLFHLSEAIEVSLLAFAVAGFFHPVAYHLYFYYLGGLALGARGAALNEVRSESEGASTPGLHATSIP